jgi:hypothetical protein
LAMAFVPSSMYHLLNAMLFKDLLLQMWSITCYQINVLDPYVICSVLVCRTLNYQWKNIPHVLDWLPCTQ